MSEENEYRPYTHHSTLGGCCCGSHASQAVHDRQAALTPESADQDKRFRDFIEAAAVRALFPHEPTRRMFLKAVGASTAMAAIAAVLPLAPLQALAAETGPLEKKNLKIGFIPINCATPLIMADPMGFYQAQGLDVTLQKTAGWALIRDNMVNSALDAAHMLAPMPLAMSMGLGSQVTPMHVAQIQNTNGQALTLALKHKDNRDPKNWKGMKFAIPFEFSMHNFLLRYYLAEHGIDPDEDVQLRVTPPAEMIANLRAGNIDGFLGPDPFNQRAVYDGVGFIHLLSKDIWDGHPCCSFAVSDAFVKENPNTFAALYRAILNASAAAGKPENIPEIARVISTRNYLNQPEIVVKQALDGRYADGLGQIQHHPDRARFDPMPWYSMATWMLSQMKRWGYIKQQVDYRALAEQVFLMTDARRHMAQLGVTGADEKPVDGYRKFDVMGKAYDAAQTASYIDSFAIKRG